MINWRVRIKNRNFWLAIIPALVLLAQTVGAVFGVPLERDALGDKLVALVNAVFCVLAILGIVNDPTTAGLGDSENALTYEFPKK